MDRRFEQLNPMQKEAVFTTQGPLLILAGAGSGKTRVLTHRIVYLIEEMGVNPWNIMAITFTNKAAREMEERVEAMAGAGSGVWVSTFHSTCVRILRRYIDHIGYGNNFTIYDSDDQKSAMKEIFKRLNIDSKMYKERAVLHAISSAKDEMIDPQEFLLNAEGDFRMQTIGKIYEEYQKKLKLSNALDFDDLLVKTVELFKEYPQILEAYQERFLYVMVDEYQDTNTVQFEFIRLLSSKYRNLCVVGDDDQSIYKFRGANIKNILDFEKVFPDASVIKLEQNYRSTQNILDAANEVIANNSGRKEKRLWTSNDRGELVHFRQFYNAYEEAEYIAGEISRKVREGLCNYKDFAILYRTNAQSRLFEEKFLFGNIPYKLVGGINFYSRKEIKDILAYLKTIDNGSDDVAVRRIINLPKRGIGAASIGRVADYGEERLLSFYDACRESSQVEGIGKAVTKISSFVHLIEQFREKSRKLPVSDLIIEIMKETGYQEELEREDTEEARERLENIDELLNKAVVYQQNAKEASLSGFLEEVALIADIDNVEDSDDKVLLMTLHSAKGLEFPHVYMAGMEDGIFPGHQTLFSDDKADLEEERRLCYVGITRAKKELTLTCAQQRMIRGQTQYSKSSMFVREIPRDLVDLGREIPEKSSEKIPVAGDFMRMRESFRAKVFEPEKYKVVKADSLDYDVGDRIRHIKFGEGSVEKIVDGGKDFEVTVNFDRVGVKKMFAAFAKLKKI